MSAARHRNDAGSTLVEALVALVLIAIAGLVVASSATTGLRATRRAANLTRTTALAARELARLASTAATATSSDTTFAVTGFVEPVTCASAVEREDGLATLAVTVDAGRPPEHVALSTRRLLESAE